MRNGWYEVPREEKFKIYSNWSYFEEFSEKECGKLAHIMPNYFHMNINDMWNNFKASSPQFDDIQKDNATEGDIPEWAIWNMFIHASAKCVMRGRVGFCMFFFCLLESCFG